MTKSVGTADLATFTEEILNGKFYFLCSALNKTPLGETVCLSNFYYLLTAQTSSFLIHPLPLSPKDSQLDLLW